MKNSKSMSFLEHLAEARVRILKSLLAVLVFFIPAYAFSERIFVVLMRPILDSLPEGSTLIFTHPAEGFTTYLKVSFFTALAASFPVVLYQAWQFVAPALYKKEKRVAVPLVFFGTLFFALGAGFCYFVACPPAFEFLLGKYSSEYVRAMPSIGSALSFLMSLMVGFGLVFEFPVVTFVLARLGLVNADMLKRKRKYALIISAVAAAVITPTTDALSMMFMLVPIIVFYELSIGIAWMFGPKKYREKSQEQNTNALYESRKETAAPPKNRK
ncbi:MAG: twin-arginine translocase subunit TatC [Candidatus Dadabacteria bacterium]|nr:twin-arginine translocase subunit TatC [Candidatus Dadabacteria bacterium]